MSTATDTNRTVNYSMTSTELADFDCSALCECVAKFVVDFDPKNALNKITAEKLAEVLSFHATARAGVSEATDEAETRRVVACEAIVSLLRWSMGR